jgi:hypothetical protein
MEQEIDEVRDLDIVDGDRGLVLRCDAEVRLDQDRPAEVRPREVRPIEDATVRSARLRSAQWR